MDSFLSGLISVKPVKCHRPKKSLDEVRLNDFSNEYKVHELVEEKHKNISLF